MSYLTKEDVKFVYNEDYTVAWILKDKAIVHIPEITIDYIPLIDKEIKTLVSEIMDTYNIEYQIEISKQITGLLILKREIL